MGWLEDILKWLRDHQTPTPPPGPNPEPPPDIPAPVFTMGPQPFGVATTVAGIEWKTDQRTSGVVMYRQVGATAWLKVVDDSRQQDHQRTLEPLHPDTPYQAEVTATNPSRGGKSTSVQMAFRTLAEGAPPNPVPEPPPVDGDGSRMPSPIGTSNVATCNADEAEECLRSGMTLVQAEAIPFDAEKNGQGISAYSLTRLVDIARKVQAYPDSTFFLTLVNWNGHSQRAQSTAWFQGLLNDAKTHLEPILGPRLALEGVSEPDNQDAKCKEWQRLTAASGIGTLVGNGTGGRGVPLHGGIVDYHYCEIGELIASLGQDRLHSTDCTPALASNLSENDVRRATRDAIRLRSRMILYDTDNAPRLNRNVLRWMQDELARSVGGTTTIPHAPDTVDLLGKTLQPWTPGRLTVISTEWRQWLRAYCLGGNTTLVLAHMPSVPETMRQAGFHGRDNALWYTVSRSYAEWPWSGAPGDPDAHLSNQRRELHDFWANYIDAVLAVMKAVPNTRALILKDDGPDRCGKELGEYSLRQLSPVANRCELGPFYQD